MLSGTEVGQLPPSTQVGVTVLIPPRNISGVFMAAQEVSNRQSPPLTRAEVEKYFAPTRGELESVISYLHSAGLDVNYVSPDGFMVSASGTVQQVEGLFSVKLALFNQSGQIYYAPTSLPILRGPMEGLAVLGLTNFSNVKKNLIVLGGLHNGTLMVKGDEPAVLSAIYYDPQDLQGAYNVTPIISPNESNVTVAVIEAYGDPNIYSDVAQFDKLFHLPPANLSVIPTGPYDPYYGILTGWDVETALDVEAVHSMAPYARIDVVVAPSATSNALFQAIDYVVTQKLANVVSMSWGIPENEFATSGFFTTAQSKILNYPYANFYFALGSAEGITFLAASGDEGATGGTPVAYGGALFPASSPFVTSVGGTALYVNVTSGYLWALNSTATYGYETTWSVDPLYGQDVSTGGGPSTLFPGVTVPTVSADADPYTGLAVVAEGQLLAVGGTSLAAPTWAGVVADLDSRLGPLGDLNGVLPLVRGALHNVTFGFNGLYGPGPGTTGLGTPDGGLLLSLLSSLRPGLSISVSTDGTPWYLQGSAVQVTAYVTYDGTPVTSGHFQAYFLNSSGVMGRIPLLYNGSYWVGTFVIPENSPGANVRLQVNGTYDGSRGSGFTYLVVGPGMSLVSVLPVQQPGGLGKLAITVYANYPNGSPAADQTLEAYLVHHGRTVERAFLAPAGGGQYRGFLPLLTPVAGAYLLFVNGSAAPVYTYLYFGLQVAAVVYTPVADSMPSAYPGSNVTLLAVVNTFQQVNLTARVYSPSGVLVASIPMQLTPSLIYEANYTVPSNVTPGFYTVNFWAIGNSSSTSWELQEGFYNLSFYVSSTSLVTQVRSINQVFQGQYVRITANITYSNGTEVKYGAFSATLLPTALGFETLAVSELTEFPLQYNSSLNEWVGYYQVPSVLSPGVYQGSPPYSLAGPWDVVVSGSSPQGLTAYSNQTYVNVLPYTDVGPVSIDGNQVVGQLVTGLEGNYSIYQLYVPELNVTDAGLQLYDSYVGTLYAINSTVSVVGSHVLSMKLLNSSVEISGTTLGPSVVAVNETNSNVTMTLTSFKDVQYAFSQDRGNITYSLVDLSGAKSLSLIPEPQFSLSKSNTGITVSVHGSDLRVIEVLLNGEPVNFTVTKVEDGVLVHMSQRGTYGTNYLQVEVSDGLPYSHTFTFVNTVPSSSAMPIIVVAIALSLAVSITALTISLKRH
ncbi:pseudomonapepsin [Sulfodiicoccus acidiphilus]|uniref:Pseudomonapepsin n=1 Tax=Sulfodiicoccus acidiphilus TaxID=1670455 RepID=A0A348B6K9_9CREN|nr:pseudomonapepsin [Sulfodiicoccus acidiphilus]